MRQFSAAQLVAAFISILSLSLLVGCGGTSTTTNPVTSITMVPSSTSMNIGQVVKITGVTKNYAGSTIVADVSYSSSNPNIVSISPTGLMCAGTWDPNFIDCTPLPGKTGVGQVTITATSGSVTATAPVYSHLQVDRITVNPPTGCVSVGATPNYIATAYSTTASGCSAAVPCDITTTVGPISFFSTDLQVMANNTTTGVLTATNPGSTSIYANVAGLNSIPESALVCPIVSILIHDASSSNTAFTLAPTATQNLIADVIDSAGNSVTPVLTWSAVPAGVASLTGTVNNSVVTPNSQTVTANTGGTTIITATCSTPSCNRNINPQYGQNLVTVNVTGGTTTTVYAASTQSLTLVPISTSGNTVGTAIGLPYIPNSIVSNSAGTKVYLGSSTGIMTVDVLTATVTVSAAAVGQIVAASPNGQYLLVSDSTSGNVYVFNTAGSNLLTHPVTSSSGAFTADGQSVSFLVGQQLYYDTIFPTSTVSNLPYVPDAVDVSAQGGMTYITSSALGAIDTRTTCNQSDWQALAATNPTLVAHLPNGNGAVVVDSPSVDVVTTGTIPAGCPPTPQSTVASYNLGFGNFTARQMFISPTSSAAYIISNLPQVIAFDLTSLAPFSIPLANSAQPFSGGMTIDGTQVYVGASDGAVHNLSVANHTDAAQIAVGLKDVTGNAVSPNLVLVLPK
jgi:hypothetical protein